MQVINKENKSKENLSKIQSFLTDSQMSRSRWKRKLHPRSPHTWTNGHVQETEDCTQRLMEHQQGTNCIETTGQWPD